MVEIKKIEKSLKLLLNWLESNGYSGYDPYDIKALKWVRKLTELGNKNKLFEIFREGLFELFLMFPETSRNLLNVKPTVNAKALGLLAKAYADLFLIYNDEQYIKRAKNCIGLLEKSYNKNYPGKGWGYPFDWQAKKLIPAGTPNGIVTTAVGDAFWAMYKLTGEKKYLTVCTDICKFLTSLPVDNVSEEQLCFSYTPLFVNHVHNLNLFVAEFLIRVGSEINNNEWIEAGNKAVNYTIANQEEDGSFDYDGPPENLRGFIDNYHTGFVLRKLYNVFEFTNREDVKESLTKGYYFYVNNLFENGEIPKFRPNRKYRIDIHSSAESINCFAELSPLFPESLNIALKVANWTIDNLQDDQGYFYHGIFLSRIAGVEFISRIPYIRWGEAWMLKGLSNLIKHLNANDNVKIDKSDG